MRSSTLLLLAAWVGALYGLAAADMSCAARDLLVGGTVGRRRFRLFWPVRQPDDVGRDGGAGWGAPELKGGVGKTATLQSGVTVGVLVAAGNVVDPATGFSRGW